MQSFLPALSDNWSSFLSGSLRQVLLYNQQSILCQCVGKYTTQISTVASLIHWPNISENGPPFFAPWVTLAHQF